MASRAVHARGWSGCVSHPSRACLADEARVEAFGSRLGGLAPTRTMPAAGAWTSSRAAESRQPTGVSAAVAGADHQYRLPVAARARRPRRVPSSRRRSHNSRVRKTPRPLGRRAWRCMSRWCPREAPRKLISRQDLLLPGTSRRSTAGLEHRCQRRQTPAPLHIVTAGYREGFTAPAPAPGCCDRRRSATGRSASRKPRSRSPYPCPEPRSRRRTGCRIR